MKTFLVATLLALALGTGAAGVRADELSLNGGTPPAVAASPAAPAAQTPAAPADKSSGKIHLGLETSESTDETVFEVPVATVAPAAAPTATATAASADANWVAHGTVRSLTLDPPRKERPVALAASALPTDYGLNSGLSDSMVESGLGVLLIAFVWACSGYLSRRGATPIQEVGQRTFERVRRTKMIPLNPTIKNTPLVR